MGPGNLIIEVAGQPFFVFQGTVPAYRDMAPGESGSDIAQLQAGLESLGFSVGGDTSGVYGPGTSAAVAAFYRASAIRPQPLRWPEGPPRSGGPAVRDHVRAPVSRPGAEARGPRWQRRERPGGNAVIGSPSINGQLNPAFGSLVRPGMRVTITTQGSPAAVHGTVASVARKAQTGKSISGGLYYPMHIKLRRALPPSMGPGQNVILSIQAAQSNGPMLAVPEAALFGGQDGKDYVSKVTGPDTATESR